MAIHAGNYRRAQRDLQEQGLKVGHGTLRNWVLRYPVRYAQLREDRVREIEMGLVDEWRRVALTATQNILKANELIHEQLEAAEVKNPSGVAREQAITAGIASDKMRILSDRPSQIVERRDPTETIQALVKSGVLTVEGSAEEIVEPAQLEEGDE
jgi:hypothetical protein